MIHCNFYFMLKALRIYLFLLYILEFIFSSPKYTTLYFILFGVGGTSLILEVSIDILVVILHLNLVCHLPYPESLPSDFCSKSAKF